MRNVLSRGALVFFYVMLWTVAFVLTLTFASFGYLAYYEQFGLDALSNALVLLGSTGIAAWLLMKLPKLFMTLCRAIEEFDQALWEAINTWFP